MPDSDPRLERLYDYTKFHIGIYLLAAGAMVTIAGSAELRSFFSSLMQNRLLLWGAIGAMGIAGAAGGVIASTCAISGTLEEVWDSRIGPWRLRIMPGRRWAALEHTAFWASAGLFTLALLLPGRS